MSTINGAVSGVNGFNFAGDDLLDDDLAPVTPDQKGVAVAPVAAASANATAYIKANPRPPAPLSDSQKAAHRAMKLNKMIVALAAMYRATMLNVWAKTQDADLLSFGADDFNLKPQDVNVFLRGADRAASEKVTITLPYGAGDLELNEGDIYRVIYISRLVTTLDADKKVVSRTNMAKFPPDRAIREWAVANGYKIDDHSDFDTDPTLACIAFPVKMGYTKADLVTYKAARAAGDKSAIHPQHKAAASRGIVLNAEVEANYMRALFAEFVDRANAPRLALLANNEWLDNYARADVDGGPLLLAKSKVKGLPADPGYLDASEGMWSLTLAELAELIGLDDVASDDEIAALTPEPADLLE